MKACQISIVHARSRESVNYSNAHLPPGQPGAFARVVSPGGGAFAYPERPPVFAIRVSESAMEEFIGKDEAFVEDWLVRQGLDKLVDIFKGTISQFKILLDYL